MSQLSEAIEKAVDDLFSTKASLKLERPDEQFGDFSTNIAMQLAPRLGSGHAGQDKQSPKAIAEKLLPEIEKLDFVESAAAAGPGFINITLTDRALLESLSAKSAQPLKGKIVVAEYSDPNPFKVLHAGHLYTSIVGDAIARLQEAAGAKVYRANFGGDVGLHAAKTMWGIIEHLGGEKPEKLAAVPAGHRSEGMAAAYVAGNKAYDEDEAAKAAITKLNIKLYVLHDSADHDSPLAKIYWTARQWSYDYFEQFYKDIKVAKFDKYYPESQTAPIGLKIVKDQLAKGVFKESDGAVIFEGEPYGLHTRVFVTSDGLPTYETKDVGLLFSKNEDYHFDRSIVITGNEILEYMKVVLKAIEQFQPELVKKTTHLTHGMVKLQGGAKMSSRQGNIVKAQDVLDEAAKAAAESHGKAKDDSFNDVVLAAVKYAFLKQRLGGDIIYDPQESVSTEGNSGPYLQYAHARAKSILAKAKNASKQETRNRKLEPAERSLARKISEFPEVVSAATAELLPSHITTYLYELAQNFNRFYESNRVVGDPRQDLRLNLVQHYADVLKTGLELLGIVAPEHI